MLHPNRRFRVRDRSALSVSAFAAELADQTHLCCQGYQYKNLLLVNDATCEDGVQEFALVRDGRHIDHLNCSWNDADRVARLLEMHMNSTDPGYDQDFTLLEHKDGFCHLCL